MSIFKIPNANCLGLGHYQLILVSLLVLPLSNVSFKSAIGQSPITDLAIIEMEREARMLAKAEKERVRRERQDLQEKITKTERLAVKVLGYDSLGITDPKKSRSVYLDRLERNRKRIERKILEFPWAMRGEIASGKALNFLLEECGPVAFEMDFYRKISDNGLPPGADPSPGSLAASVNELGLLDTLTINHKIDDSIIGEIRYKRGLSGSKITGRIGQSPLDLNWPSILMEPDYEKERKSIEELKDKALSELKEGRPISPEVSRDLFMAVEEILRKVENDRIEVAQNRSEKGHLWPQYRAAYKHIKLLLMGTKRFVEARELKHVQIEGFDGGNIEQLLAFMHRNQCRFAEADLNGQQAYQQIFELTVRYYVRIQTFKDMLEADKRLVAQMLEKEEKLEDIQFGRSLSNLQQWDLIGKALEFISK